MRSHFKNQPADQQTNPAWLKHTHTPHPQPTHTPYTPLPATPSERKGQFVLSCPFPPSWPHQIYPGAPGLRKEIHQYTGQALNNPFRGDVLWNKGKCLRASETGEGAQMKRLFYDNRINWVLLNVKPLSVLGSGPLKFIYIPQLHPYLFLPLSSLGKHSSNLPPPPHTSLVLLSPLS